MSLRGGVRCIFVYVYFPHLLGGFLHILTYTCNYMLWPLAPREYNLSIPNRKEVSARAPPLLHGGGFRHVVNGGGGRSGESLGGRRLRWREMSVATGGRSERSMPSIPDRDEAGDEGGGRWRRRRGSSGAGRERT
jgi:hypothetical protein